MTAKTGFSCLRVFVVAFVFVVYSCALSIRTSQSASPDWPQWRGPNRDGAIASFTPPKGWPSQLARKWKVDVGIGYASPVLVGNRVYMFSRRGENEVLAALDAGTGAEIWRTGYTASFTVN